MENILRQFTDILGRSPRLLGIGEQEASERPASGGWSKKEVLGHLIDSAANNHQRFVRLQRERTLTFPGYDQNGWVAIQQYQQRGWADLVELWAAYNRHLCHLIAQMDPRTLENVWQRPEGELTLRFLLEDYLAHMRHHLRQIAGTEFEEGAAAR